MALHRHVSRTSKGMSAKAVSSSIFRPRSHLEPGVSWMSGSTCRRTASSTAASRSPGSVASGSPPPYSSASSAAASRAASSAAPAQVWFQVVAA